MNRDVSYARALPSVSFPIASRWTNTRSPRDCQSPPSRVHFRKFIARQNPSTVLFRAKENYAHARWYVIRSSVEACFFSFQRFFPSTRCENFQFRTMRCIFLFRRGNFTRFTQGNNLYVKEDVVQKYFYRSREVIASLKSGSWRILEMDEFLHARVFILYLRGKKEEFEVDRNVLFLEIYRTSNLRRR